MTTPTPRKRRSRYSANAVVRREAELQNISPEFGVKFFFDPRFDILPALNDEDSC